MKYLYLFLNLFSISVPFILSFEKRVQFYKKWRFILPAIVVVAAGFIAWDVYFTKAGYWGFNAQYLSGISALGLPLGEWLFFFTVPYACIFIYETFRAYFLVYVNRFPVQWFMLVFFALMLMLLVFNFGKPYTISALGLGLFILGYIQLKKPAYTKLLMVSYLVTIVPFLMVNGVLTGSFIQGEVVWYNPTVFSGIRLFTIPIEDLVYSFDLLALNVILMEWLKTKYKILQA